MSGLLSTQAPSGPRRLRWPFGPWRAGLPGAVGALALFLACGILGGMTAVAGVVFADKPALLFGLPAVMALGFLFFVDRHVLLLGLLLARPALDAALESTKISLGSSSMGLGSLLNALVLALTAAIWLSSPPGRFRPAAVYLGPYLLIAGCSILYSPLPLDAAKLFMALLAYGCAFVIGGHLTHQLGGVRQALKFLLACSLLPVLIDIGMVLADQPFKGVADIELSGSEVGRFAGPFTHPNIMAFYMLLNIALAVYIWRTRAATDGVLIRKALPGYILAMIAMLVLTKTRSAWLACLVFFVGYGCVVDKKVLMYLVGASVLSLAVPEVQDRLLDLGGGTNLYDPYAKLNSYDWRKAIWADGIAYMKPSRYLTGYGLESFRFFSPDFFRLSGGLAFQAHSVYVQMLFELGIAGLIGFLWLLTGPALQLWRPARLASLPARLGLLLLLSYAVICYADNVLFCLAFNLYFWASIGAIQAGLCSNQKTEVQ